MASVGLWKPDEGQREWVGGVFLEKWAWPEGHGAGHRSLQEPEFTWLAPCLL